MEAAFFELSKYILAILLAFYTFECFAVFRYKNPDDKKGIYLRQNIIMFLIHFIGFMAICFKTGDMFYLFFYAFQQIVLFATIALFRMVYPMINKLTVNNMCMLLTIGFIVLTRISQDKALKQFKIILISLLISLVIPFLIKKMKFLKDITWIYGLLGFGALSIVFILGSVTNGSKISYSIYGVTFQPSEFVKILFVFFVASLLYKKNDLKRIFISSIVAALHVFVLVASKDLGSALIFFIVYITMLYIATKKMRFLLLGIFSGCIGSVLAYYLFNHVQVRYEVWLNPWIDIQGKGYQITQSLFAIGTGGWFGMGIYQGTPGSIPYVAADFIFSAIAEEFGVIFSLCLILLCISCFIMFMNIAMKLKDEFYRLIAVGLGVTYIFQVFLTIGGGTKFIPLTGVTLPLISYGGSSVLTTLIIFSIIQGLYLIDTDECMVGDECSLEEEIFMDEESVLGEERVIREESVLEGEKSSSNKHIVIITYLFVFIFLGLMGHITKFMLIDSVDVINNVYNPRQEILEVQNIRGQILSTDGEILATTISKENGEEERAYPYNNLFAHVVGYSTKGKTGIESLGNFYLLNSHEAMNEKLQNDLSNKKNQGDTVITTLDVDLQKVASEALGNYQGAIIVMEPSTGKVLAMVSNPNFNPNEINDIWMDLSSDTESSVLLNRATGGLYPPGSTFKILTALEYIREHPDSYNDYSYTCTGSFHNNDDTIKCYQGAKHGVLDLTESFAHSCNSSFANIGISLDSAKFLNTLNQMLFNSNLPIDLNYNKSSVTVSDDSMIQTSIGQGTTQVTPIHMALITSTIANNGTLMTPYFIEKIVNNNGSYVKKFSPVAYGTLMSQEETEILTNMMIEVVESGTADKLKGLEYNAAGKTGSAEYNTTKGDSHAWFTGFAPFDNPQIVVTIIVEGAGSGGDYAVPIAKLIFDAYFEKYSIFEK